jgi:hypothetical protein
VPKSHHWHGLLTPQRTLAPEDARITADKERRARAAEESGSMPPIVEIFDSEEVSTTQTKSAFDVGSQGDSEESDDDEASPPSKSQVEADEYVFTCSRNGCRLLLEIGASSGGCSTMERKRSERI